ncbi:MAG: HlyC/CorC family transporter [Candidatus Pacebacteria bacterium]|nr:HlyC/CorC family transporter [Candidatus Paceibacterota bacterium]
MGVQRPAEVRFLHGKNNDVLGHELSNSSNNSSVSFSSGTARKQQYDGIFMQKSATMLYLLLYMIQLVVLVVLVVIFSFIFAMAEAALFSVPLTKAKLLAEKNVFGGKTFLAIKEHPSRPIATLVLLNNITNIVGSIFIGHMATKVLGDSTLGLISAVVTFLIVVFGEILPKTIGENYAEGISLAFANPLRFLTRVFTPFTYLLHGLTKHFLKKKRYTSEEELRLLSQLGRLEGSIEKDEHDMINRVFTLNDLSARDIMTPRTVMEGVQNSAKLNDLGEFLFHKAYSRLPVFGESMDNVVGVLSTKKALSTMAQGHGDMLVNELMDKPFAVSEKLRVDTLLTILQKQRIHMAIVQDEFGGTAGIVTLEDALEQLVGEIVDETDDIVDLREEAKRIQE